MSRDSELPEFVFGPKQTYLRKIIEPALENPVYRKRWDAKRESFVAAVQERADGLDLSFHGAVLEVALGAISAAVSKEQPPMPPIRFEGSEPAPDSVAAWGRVFNNRVDEHATEALLGTAWREHPAVLAPPLPKDEFGLALQLDFFLQSGRLTASETRIALAVRNAVLSGGEIHEAADHVRMRYNAVTKALERIRRKAS